MQEASSHSRRFSPLRTGDATPLGELESAVMLVVWAQDSPLSVSDVHAAVSNARSTAYTTIKTTMERLADKGILLQERDGKAYHYRAAYSRDELERRIVAQAMDRLVEQFPDAVASFFVRPDPSVTDERLSLLQEAIERRRTGENG
jgi:predicted transcriptional regulator